MPPCAAKSNTVSPGQALLLSLSASCFEVVSVAVTAAVFLGFFPPFPRGALRLEHIGCRQ